MELFAVRTFRVTYLPNLRTFSRSFTCSEFFALSCRAALHDRDKNSTWNNAIAKDA